MENFTFTQWQYYAHEVIIRTLDEKGYLDPRFARVTLAQKVVHRVIDNRRISLSEYPARIAFLVSYRSPYCYQSLNSYDKSSQRLTEIFSGE